MSWIEVETKIRVKDPDAIRKRIQKIARFVRKEQRVDDYYTLEKGRYPRKSLRVRDRGKKREVNFKERYSYVDGVWAKKEVEFGVSDLQNFFDLLDDFGFHKWIRKEKHAELYKTKDGIGIELNYVKKLGWFIEIEALCGKKDVVRCRKRVVQLRKELGFSARDSVKAGYTKGLWDKKN